MEVKQVLDAISLVQKQQRPMVTLRMHPKVCLLAIPKVPSKLDKEPKK
jgi:hypothetical protein